MEIEALYQEFIKSRGVSTDTRKITRGSIYFALRGEHFNGNAFAEEALKKGASKAVVDERVETPRNEDVILVDDALKTLQELARFHRRKLKTPIIAITGSNGKTTTKKLCQAFFSTTFTTFATQGNLNNHIGVPLSLLQIDESIEIALIELGADHQKEIERLCDICEPDFGYVTNFGKDHLEGFGGVEGVIKANSELYDYLKKIGGKIFIDLKDELQRNRSEGGDLIPFNHKDDIISLISAKPFLKVKMGDRSVLTNLVGDYNFQNIAAAFSMANYFGIPNEPLSRALADFTPEDNRSQFIKTDNNQIILDAYNANPSSMELAIDNFALLEGGSKSVILGDMLELGTSSYKEHQITIHQLEQLDLKRIYLVGEAFFEHYFSSDTFLFLRNFDELKAHLQEEPIDDQLLLIKGSRGIALERCIDLL
jgi:UDP-N-acetylmuramoyl-tripeptide--D-alanyl-D-alanine ligase